MSTLSHEAPEPQFDNYRNRYFGLYSFFGYLVLYQVVAARKLLWDFFATVTQLSLVDWNVEAWWSNIESGLLASDFNSFTNFDVFNRVMKKAWFKV